MAIPRYLEYPTTCTHTLVTTAVVGKTLYSTMYNPIRVLVDA
jgi:hypothetical protein